jgi:hypothetical protein
MTSGVFPQRRVHLDFHTSPHIPDVGCEFDARRFGQTFKRAGVDSVTVFAKCHHGMCYFPTKTGTAHPALRGRDLLGEMIAALHREGIKAPLYTTVAWEEDVASRFPAWRQMRADGTFAQRTNLGPDGRPQPGAWRFNDWTHPEYQDYIEAHVRELLSRYGTEVDGLFFDILAFDRCAHYSESALRLRARHGLLGHDFGSFKRFEALAQDRFALRFTKLIKARRPAATVFYNASYDTSGDPRVGGRVLARHVTHLEIESLPSGPWGYFHFPRLARGAGRWGLPWLGMTGRFQRTWGDFGGIRPQPALEYDCFRSQALGGGNSVGDQLPPRGAPDPAAYALIGAVYSQCEAAEPFYAGTVELHSVGILTANWPEGDPTASARSDEGAVQMCEEIHYDATVLDMQSDFSGYALLLLPDAVVVAPGLRRKLQAYWRHGGSLLLSHHAGRDASGRFALDFLPLAFAGEAERFPSYWRARKPFWPEWGGSDRVVYARGANVVRRPGLEVLVERVPPYFQRSDLKFSSHYQAPPLARVGPHPAVVAGKAFVYLADPIFREYRESGNTLVRDACRRVMERLIGPPPFAAGLPTTMLCIPRRRRRDLRLTLLHYVPVRKALAADVLEERMGFAGEALRLPPAARAVRVFPGGKLLDRSLDGSFLLPQAKGRLLLEVPGFFPAAPRRNASTGQAKS